jgi:hypothetical protein
VTLEGIRNKSHTFALRPPLPDPMSDPVPAVSTVPIMRVVPDSAALPLLSLLATDINLSLTGDPYIIKKSGFTLSLDPPCPEGRCGGDGCAGKHRMILDHPVSGRREVESRQELYDVLQRAVGRASIATGTLFAALLVEPSTLPFLMTFGPRQPFDVELLTHDGKVAVRDPETALMRFPH